MDARGTARRREPPHLSHSRPRANRTATVLRIRARCRQSDQEIDDRLHGQRIRSVNCEVRDRDIAIRVAVSKAVDIDLETWAAERVSDVFLQVYGKPLTVVRA